MKKKYGTEAPSARSTSFVKLSAENMAGVILPFSVYFLPLGSWNHGQFGVPVEAERLWSSVAPCCSSFLY